MNTATYSGPCGGHVRHSKHGNFVTCDATPAVGVVMSDLPDGRADHIEVPRCAKHGGEMEARIRAARAWPVAAPEGVGDDAAVRMAGSAGLCSPDAVIVIRRLPDRAQPELAHIELPRDVHAAIVAAIGERSVRSLGWIHHHRCVTAANLEDTLKAVARWTGIDRAALGETVVRKPARTTPGGWGGYLGLGTMCQQVGSYSTRDKAVAATTKVWRVALATSVARITAARGGTLAWGIAVEPLDEPLVIDAKPGVSSWYAYHWHISHLENPL